MAKSDHIFDLERRQQALEDEIEKALLQRSPDDLMIVNLRHRMLHVRNEIKRLSDAMARDRRLH